MLIICISVLVGIFLLVYIIPYITVLYNLNNADRNYTSKVFGNNKDHFDDLKDDLLKLKDNYKKDDYISLDSDGDTWFLYEGESLDFSYINEDITDKLWLISNQFEGECLDRITISDNQISFSLEENSYGIIYRKDDTKPLFMNNSSESFKITTKKIEKHWYYCETK